MAKARSSREVSLHQLVHKIDTNVIDVLPAVHALSGCDTTTKTGTKKSTFQTAKESGEEYLKSFAKSPINDDIVTSAEKFLVVECLSNDKNIQTFDHLCFQTYHKKSFQLDLEKLPCMSNSIQLHIKCSFLQCYRWLQSPICGKYRSRADGLWIHH